MLKHLNLPWNYGFGTNGCAALLDPRHPLATKPPIIIKLKGSPGVSQLRFGDGTSDLNHINY